jgi:transposase
MTINTDTTSIATFVAIDIAKRRHDVMIVQAENASESFEVANTLEDFQRFSAYLRSLPTPLQIAFEPTADYHRNIAWHLLQDGYDIRLVSSVACARTREAVFNSRDKNDPKDTRVILHLMRTGITQRYYDPLANGHHDLQELANTYSVTVYRRTQLLHSLKNHYLTLYFPEIEKYFCSSRSRWFMETFHRFPTPASIVSFSEERFVAEAWPMVGKKHNKKQWLKDLYATARQSVGLPIGDNSVALEMYRTILAEYAQITRLRDSIECRADEVLHDNPDYRALRTIPGIGPIVALIVLAESGNLRRFQHHRQFLKYCGLDLATYQSGMSRGRTSLSKRGNARLRYAFWMAANRAIMMNENTFRSKYERYIQSNRHDADLKRKARTAVAAKMARVAYSIVKHGTTYRPYHESGIPGGKIPLVRAVEAEMTS